MSTRLSPSRAKLESKKLQSLRETQLYEALDFICSKKGALIIFSVGGSRPCRYCLEATA